MRRSLGSIVDLDVLGLGKHQDAGRRGVDPALRLGGRYPLHAVHATLVLEPGERRFTGLGVPRALTATETSL